MKYVFLFVLAFSVAVCDAELKLEATDGENVTISFKTAELKRADRVSITFTRENRKTLIAQYCRCVHCRDCDVVETPGVLLRVEGTVPLILLDVSSNNSGLYEARVFIGNDVSEIKATLVVKKPAFSSTKAPLQISTPNPPNSSGHLWLYALLIPLVILGVVTCSFWRKKCRREREPLPDAEEARETPAVSRHSIFKNNKCKRNCRDCVAVSFKACREDTEDQLVDT
ncbi:uncharacterized protein LOC107653225 isoform X1 [Sinocyclocheilus anshuiensis]|uniref:uncharacterized protein LOC107653225 isoform X1 n=1 Tax=Sinocyclocheilus anshuiensis TaxID=1608454 RepID=UPI0007B7AF78|nr:PREDICTED: uncharacterized protein LOC107653225 isoform X1 [Sinocyclocheilus anshuiensis]